MPRPALARSAVVRADARGSRGAQERGARCAAVDGRRSVPPNQLPDPLGAALASLRASKAASGAVPAEGQLPRPRAASLRPIGSVGGTRPAVTVALLRRLACRPVCPSARHGRRRDRLSHPSSAGGRCGRGPGQASGTPGYAREAHVGARSRSHGRARFRRLTTMPAPPPRGAMYIYVTYTPFRRTVGNFPGAAACERRRALLGGHDSSVSVG